MGFSQDDDQNNDLPDWLRDLQSGNEDSGFSSSDPFSSDSGDEETPDWMRDISQGGSFSEPEEGDEEAVPDWLEDIRQGKSDAAPTEPEEPAVEETGDWLENIRKQYAEESSLMEEDDEPEIPQGDISFERADETDEDTPDWLSGLPSLDVEPTDVDSLEQESAGEEEFDWLNNIRTQSEKETAFLSEDEPQKEEDDHNWLEELQSSDLGIQSDEDGDEEAYGGAAEFMDEDVSSLLLESSDLPDWLDDVEIEDEEPAEQAPEPDKIERAELPGWLQAIRPVEAVTGGAEIEDEEMEDREAETIGPLTGLSDVLPAEPHVVHFGTRATPTPRFELTDVQQHYARLLRTMVEEEKTAKPIQRRNVVLPQQILRWVIAVLLLSVLFAAIWMNGNFIPLPGAGIPEENLAVISLVDGLSAGDTVLVAFEYQPALSGEMEAASSAVIEHMLLKGVELVVFSTQPTGPGQAEAFFGQSQFASYDYIQNHRYRNLGYLSGGTAGLLNFAGTPRRTVPLIDAAGASLWDQAPLNTIQTIRDFSMVLVITDDPDTARTWVEQVQPLLDPDKNGLGTPLAMVTSAQAEPLVYPYYMTSPRQVAGYISGLTGGAYYETTTNQPALARGYWDAFNVGLMLAVIIIAIGTVINLARTTLVGKGKGRS